MFMIELEGQSLYTFLGVSPDATAAEIRKARDGLIFDLREKQRAAKDKEEKHELEERQKEINAAGETLARPEEREKYDRNNAHLRFFLVRVAAVPMFAEKRDRLEVLHGVIREFLAEKNVAVVPLSDLGRTDFSADETPIRLLDDHLKER